jgi:protein tweety
MNTNLLSNEQMRAVGNIFHKLPHLNMWFRLSNVTFNPNDPDYLETILFWSTVPILFLILLLFFLIIYACCLVCSSNAHEIKLQQAFSLNRKRKKLSKFKCFVILFITFLSVSLGFLVFGSEQFHHSFNEFTDNVGNFSSYFTVIINKTNMAKQSISNDLDSTLNTFETAIIEKTKNSFTFDRQTDTALTEIKSIRVALNSSFASISTLDQLEYEQRAYIEQLMQLNIIEQTRWAIMIGVVTVNMLLILLLAIGLVKNSKGSLCFFAFAGVLSLISIWILNALYLGVTVFIADYCTRPNDYILTVAERNHMKNRKFCSFQFKF